METPCWRLFEGHQHGDRKVKCVLLLKREIITLEFWQIESKNSSRAMTTLDLNNLEMETSPTTKWGTLPSMKTSNTPELRILKTRLERVKIYLHNPLIPLLVTYASQLTVVWLSLICVIELKGDLTCPSSHFVASARLRASWENYKDIANYSLFFIKEIDISSTNSFSLVLTFYCFKFPYSLRRHDNKHDLSEF